MVYCGISADKSICTKRGFVADFGVEYVRRRKEVNLFKIVADDLQRF